MAGTESWAQLWSYLVPDIISPSTVIPVAAALAGYLLKRRHERRSERIEASNNLYYELKDTWDGLEIKSHPKDFFRITIENLEYRFMHRFFNHGIYDSFIFSGRINSLSRDLQQLIQDIFGDIKDHNRYLMEVKRMLAYGQIERIRGHCLYMEHIEGKLLKTLPIAMRMLARDAKIKSQDP